MTKDLNKLRKEVDKLDKEMITLLKKRFKIAIEIWKIKKPLGMKIKNPKREKEIIDNFAKESGFNKKFVKELYNIIFIESRRLQREW
jgi:monofunctional chorismate mutase